MRTQKKEVSPTKQLQSLVTGHYQHKCEMFKRAIVQSWVSDHWLTKHFILYILGYVYLEKNLRRIIVLLTLLQNLYQDNYAEQESYKLLKLTTVILCFLSIVQQNIGY